MSKNIYQKLLEIQNVINGLGKNKQGNGYQYVNGDKVLGHIKPLMKEHGLLLKQEIVSIDNTRQDYVVGINASNPSGRPKSEILSKVMMKFTWVDCETGEKDENSFGANGQNDWDKGVGSALTYAERYFLLKYFHIPTDEDDIDNPDRKPTDEELPKQPAAPQTSPQTPAASTGKKLTPPAEADKKWLNVTDGKKNFTEEWVNLQKAILENKIKSLDDVRVWYKVSKDVAEKITELLNQKTAA